MGDLQPCLNVDALVREVKARPCIWDITMQEHYDRECTQWAWTLVAAALGCHVGIAQQQWMTLDRKYHDLTDGTKRLRPLKAKSDEECCVDEDYLFLASLLPSIKQCGGGKKRRLKNRLRNAVQKYMAEFAGDKT